MAQFPVEAFVNAAKYRSEREQGERGQDIRELGNVASNVMAISMQKNAELKQRRAGVIGEFIKKNMFFDAASGRQINANEIMNMHDQFIETGSIPENIQAKPIATMIPESAFAFLDPATGQVDVKGAGGEDIASTAGRKVIPVNISGLKGAASPSSFVDKERNKKILKAEAEYIDVKSGYDDTVKQLNDILLKNENTYSGTIENMKGELIKFTGIGAENEKFKNTADVVNQLKDYVAKTLRSTFGGQLSDSERAYLNEVYGAASKYTKEERNIAVNNIKKMLDMKLEKKRQEYEMWKSGSVGSEQSTGTQRPVSSPAARPVMARRFKLKRVVEVK